MSGPAFDHATAFARTLGWITAAELAALRDKRVAIAGLGGVGGAHLVTLTRLGVGRFSVADPDVFELSNMNRQVGASMETLGRPKVEVMVEMAKGIDPEIDVDARNEAIGAANVDAFLEGADLFVDGLDVFALDARRLVFARCADRGIPAITAAPLGMGAALLYFAPGRMSFERYFRMEGHDREEQLLRFLVGLAPSAMQRHYLVDPSRLSLDREQVPSTPMGVELAAGMAGTAALQILLGRGRVPAAPWGTHFDAYAGRVRHTWRPFGNAGLLQRVALFMARRALVGRRSLPASSAR
jgi:molybdopterin/thiamine biosynthesis adenylyltransferase